MKYVLYGLIGLVAIAVGAAAIGPAFVNWNAYKDNIAREVREATGRTLVIAGDLRLAILPSPSLFVSDVRLRPAAGGAEDMARLKALSVDVKLMPLLRGRIQVARMTLIEPVVTVEVGSDGRTNWDAPSGAPKAAQPAGPLGQVSEPREMQTASDRVRLDDMRVQNGMFVYRDTRSGVERRFDRLNAGISAATLSGPFDITAAANAAGVPVSIRASVGEIAGRSSAPVDLLASVVDAPENRLEFKGRLVNPAAAPRLVGTVKGKSADVGAILARAGRKDLSHWAGIAFDLDAQFDASPSAASLNDLVLNLGDSRVAGGVSVALGATPQLDVTLKARRLDIDKLRPLVVMSEPAPAATGKDKSAPQAAPFALPAAWAGSLEFSVDSLTVVGREFRMFRAEATLDGGAVKLARAAASLPGGTEVALAGTLKTPFEGPKFDGTLKFSADNLRAVIGWFGIDLAGVSEDRLRRASFTADVHADPKEVRVANLDAKLDASVLKGGLTYPVRERPSFGASLALDVLNLDAYLAPAPKGQKGSGKADGKTAGAKKDSPLSVLNDFDANFSLSVGQVTYRETPMRGVRAKASLLRGKLTVEDASIRSLGGAAVTVAGTVSSFDKTPVFKGRVGAEASDVSGLMRLAGYAPTASVRKLGGMKLNAKADVVDDKMGVDAKLDFAGAKLSLNGAMLNYLTKPSLDFKIEGRHPDLPRLAALFDVEMSSAKGQTAAVTMKGTVKGDSQKPNVSIELSAFGALAAVTGAVASPMNGARLDLSVEAGHPDFAALMRDLAPEYRPKGGAKIGPASLRAKVTGDPNLLALANLRAAVGPASVTGDGELQLSGKRPVLAARLSAGDILLDPLLPADASTTGEKDKKGKEKAADRAKREEFSREPLDVSFLDAMDAIVSFSANSVTRRNIRIDGLVFAAVVKDRILTVTKASGQLFKGSFDLRGRLNGRGVPSVQARLAIKNARVDKALLDTADLDFASGVLDLDVDLKGAGKSEHDLVSALAGKVAIKGRDGVIKGFDLPAVSKRLNDINRGTDILTLLASGMAGGSTPFSRLTGTFSVNKGVAHTKDLTLVAEGGTARSVGAINLPPWSVDLLTTVSLAEHAKAPPFTVRTVGPLDDPRQVFKFDKLQKYLLQRSMSQFLNKVLSQKPAPRNERPEPTPAPQPAPKPRQREKPKAEDILRGLLKGLERR